jgi:RimJ/RimL family protein N-acetyltransferase/uncharacterized damage-inducible protein DinB/quinol monooxygenase YgiN
MNDHDTKRTTMTKFGLTGKLTAQPGQREALLGHLLAAARMMKRAPGCELYLVSLAQDEPDAIWVTEAWQSKGDHDASLTLPGVPERIARARPLIAGMSEPILTVPVGGLPPTGDVALREVTPADLPVFFAQEQDPDANFMAAFTPKDPSDRAAFEAHWARILADPQNTVRTILAAGQVAGHVSSYVEAGRTEVTYWLGKEFWGRGIATRALAEFLRGREGQTLYARAAKDNLASLRVLEKCGFSVIGEDRGFANARQAEVEEYLLRRPPARDLLDRLLEHGAWTARRILELAGPLTDEQLDRDFDLGHRTVRETLAHMAINLEAWTDLLAGRPPRPRPPEAQPLAALQARFEAAYADFARTARGLRDAGRLDALYLDTLDDPPQRKSYGGTILHVLTHDHQHRAELLHMLQRLGVEDVIEGDVLGWEALEHD